MNILINKEKNKLRKIKSKKKKNQNKIATIKEKIKKIRNKRNLKEEMKNLSLDTSKQNYIDCRISISFMKRHSIPVDKIFSKVLQKKFAWAFDVDNHFKF